MAQNIAATFARTIATWAFPAGNDITLHSHDLTPSGIGLGTLDNITAGVFAAGSRATFAGDLGWLALANVSFELLLHPTTLTTTGIILRVGQPTSATAQPIVLRIFNTGSGFVWSMIRRGNLGTTQSVA